MAARRRPWWTVLGSCLGAVGGGWQWHQWTYVFWGKCAPTIHACLPPPCLAGVIHSIANCFFTCS